MPNPTDRGPDPSGLEGRLLLDRFRVERSLGHGGMGEVLLARDTLLHRLVALKRLSADGENRDQRRRAILKEARRASQINDRHIAAVYDVLDLHDDVLIVMEYVEGETLRERMARPLTMDEFWSIALQCAEAVAAAHAHGVIHRDLKPENLMLTRDGQIKVLDFGIARRSGAVPVASTSTESRSLSTAGTPQYMAPEVHLAGVADERADVFSLGVVFYEVLTGTNPFPGPTYVAVVFQIANHDPPPASTLNPSAGPEISRLIERMLAKEPEERIASAGDLLRDLHDARRGVVAPEPPRESRTAPQAAPRPARWVLPLGVTAVALMGIALWRWSAPALPNDVNLAVLAPETPGGAADFNYFALGLVDALQAQLHRHTAERDFQMTSFGDAVSQKVRTGGEARQILGANVALIPVLEQDTQRLRGRWMLVDTRTEKTLATRTAEAPVAEPFTLYDRMLLEGERMTRRKPTPSDSRRQLGVSGSGTLRFYLEGLGRLRTAESVADAELAVARFDDACRAEPEAASARAGLAQAQLRAQRLGALPDGMAKAEANAREAVARADGRVDTHTALADVFWVQRDWPAALGEFQRIVALDSTRDEAMLRAARTYTRLGQPERELETYQTAIRIRSHCWQPYWWLAAALYRAGQVDEALSAYRGMIRRAPLFHEGYSGLGALQVLRGEYGAAIDTLKRSVALRPTKDAYENLGTAYFNTERGREAIEAYNQSFQFGKPDFQSWFNLGEAHFWLGANRTESASRAAGAYAECVRLGREEIAARAAEGRPSNPLIPATLSTVFPKLGQPDSARAYVQRALAADSANPLVRFNAALTLWQLGEREPALISLRRAVEGGYPAAWLRDSPVFHEWRPVAEFQAMVGKHDPAP